MPTRSRAQAADPLGGWESYHLFYHGRQERLLLELVRPLVSSFLDRRWIDRFYFVRYGLGGPHVRLRLRWTGPSRGDLVERAAAEFFARHPSTTRVTDEEILRRNRAFLATDPEADPAQDRVFEDNSLHRFPLRFEIERYGGRELLAHSIDFFVYSSAWALLVLGEDGELSAGGRLTRYFGWSVRLAWGLAEAEEEVSSLGGYGRRLMGDALPACVEAADRYFARRRTELTRLLQNELNVLVGGLRPAEAESPGSVSEAGRRLAWEIRRLPFEARWRVAASQLHMTANRLGILNPEEVYTGRLLELAVRELASREPAFWRAAWRARPGRRAEPDKSLADLLPGILRRLPRDRL